MPSGLDALVCAAGRGDRAAVEHLLPSAPVDGRGPGGSTALAAACSRGHVDVVECLLAAGASTHVCGKPRPFDTDEAPLKIAARFGHTDVMLRLIEAGADVDQLSGEFSTPALSGVFYSGSGREDQCVAALLQAGASLELAPGLLSSAVRCCSVETVRALVAAGASLNADDVLGPPLLSAITRVLFTHTEAGTPDLQRILDMAKMLLCKGADPNLKLKGRRILPHFEMLVREIQDSGTAPPLCPESLRGVAAVVALLEREGAKRGGFCFCFCS